MTELAAYRWKASPKALRCPLRCRACISDSTAANSRSARRGNGRVAFLPLRQHEWRTGRRSRIGLARNGLAGAAMRWNRVWNGSNSSAGMWVMHCAVADRRQAPQADSHWRNRRLSVPKNCGHECFIVISSKKCDIRHISCEKASMPYSAVIHGAAQFTSPASIIFSPLYPGGTSRSAMPISRDGFT
jgi:hypothetical protein